MRRMVQLAAVFMVALLAIGSCDEEAGHGGDPAAATAAPSAAPTSSRPPGPPAPATTPAAVAPVATTPAPPPLDVVPIAYAQDTAMPAVPPLPPLPEPGSVGATVEVTGGWTGRFTLDGRDPRVSVSCGPVPAPRVGIEVAQLHYGASSEAGTGQYGLPDGGWSLDVTRSGSRDDASAVGVSLTAVDADGVDVEIPGWGTEAQPRIAATSSPDNSSIAFAYIAWVLPRDPHLSEQITWASVTGTVACPGPLPGLSWLGEDG